jgi:hypothetical protein
MSISFRVSSLTAVADRIIEAAAQMEIVYCFMGRDKQGAGTPLC